MQNAFEKLEKEHKALKLRFVNVMNNRQSDFFERCRSDDKLINLYTSLQTASKFQTIYSAVEDAVPNNNNHSISKQHQLFLTLVKLSHNLKEEDLAFRFRIYQSTVSRYFHTWICALYDRLHTHFIHWPNRVTVQESMPMCFRRNFPNVVSIIDCFETQIHVPDNPNDQTATYSNYKSRNTVKYLISITPQGTISFVSTGFVGRTSDQHVVLNSGYLDLLRKGDVILADKGFTIAADVGQRGAILTTPAFKVAAQLTQQETEESRKISNVRIHVERVIGSLRMRFDIMKGPVNLSYFKDKIGNVTFYDKIFSVCCILHNLTPLFLLIND